MWNSFSFLRKYSLCWHLLYSCLIFEDQLSWLSMIVPRYLYSLTISTVSVPIVTGWTGHCDLCVPNKSNQIKKPLKNNSVSPYIHSKNRLVGSTKKLIDMCLTKLLVKNNQSFGYFQPKVWLYTYILTK